jgi:Integrase core domain.
LIVVDYFSKYPEIAMLNSSNCQSVILQLKSIFSRHGIPKELISDNGPPYNSAQFKIFCHAWGIEHKTSSPYFPQSNGQVERTIGTIKNMLKKCLESGNDPYLALLNYRNTPKGDVCSPANLLMSRNLRSNLPISNDNLIPKSIELSKEREKILAKQDTMKMYYDRNARDLPKIGSGDGVVFKQKPQSDWVPATVVQELVPNRSFRIKTPDGVLYDRNRVHIKKMTPKSTGLPPDNQCLITPRRSTRPRVKPLRFADYVPH